MDCGSGHQLAEQLAFEKFRRQIPQMSHEQRGELLEQLGHHFYVVRPMAARLMVDLQQKAPAADWRSTAGAWVLEAQAREEACDYHW
jgi:hypothetical protein